MYEYEYKCISKRLIKYYLLNWIYLLSIYFLNHDNHPDSFPTRFEWILGWT